METYEKFYGTRGIVNIRSTNGDYKQVSLLNEYMPPIYNQLQSDACAAYATTAAVEYTLNKLHSNTSNNNLSKNFLHFISSNLSDEPGVSLEDTMQAMVQFGICEQSVYSEHNNNPPDFKSFLNAQKFRATKYVKHTTLEGILQSLLSSIPVIVSVNNSTLSDINNIGTSKLITQVTFRVEPNHSMLIVGYIPQMKYNNLVTDVFVLRNSWGTSWGRVGYCYVPVDIAVNYFIYEAYSLYLY